MSDRTTGSLVRDQRQRLGMRQGEVARALGVSQSLVSQWESDKASPAAYHRQLADVLKMEPSWLVEQFVGRTDFERELKADERLSRKEKEALGAAYRHLVGLPPLPLYVSRERD